MVYLVLLWATMEELVDFSKAVGLYACKKVNKNREICESILCVRCDYLEINVTLCDNL